MYTISNKMLMSTGGKRFGQKIWLQNNYHMIRLTVYKITVFVLSPSSVGVPSYPVRVFSAVASVTAIPVKQNIQMISTTASITISVAILRHKTRPEFLRKSPSRLFLSSIEFCMVRDTVRNGVFWGYHWLYKQHATLYKM